MSLSKIYILRFIYDNISDKEKIFFSMRMFLDGLNNNICSQLLQLLGCENGQFVVISLTKVKC